MRKLFILSVGVVMAAGLVLAQAHDNATEREARDTIVFATDVRLGSQVLAAGEYRVVCNREHISFTATGGKKGTTEMVCTGKELPDRKKATEVHTSIGPDGVRVVEKLFLKGSNVEHVFR